MPSVFVFTFDCYTHITHSGFRSWFWLLLRLKIFQIDCFSTKKYIFKFKYKKQFSIRAPRKGFLVVCLGYTLQSTTVWMFEWNRVKERLLPLSVTNRHKTTFLLCYLYEQTHRSVLLMCRKKGTWLMLWRTTSLASTASNKHNTSWSPWRPGFGISVQA